MSTRRRNPPRPDIPPEWGPLLTPEMQKRMERQDRGEEEPPTRSGLEDLLRRIFDPNYKR